MRLLPLIGLLTLWYAAGCHLLRAPTPRPPVVGVHTHVLRIGGLTRSYLFYEPAQHAPNAPLVMLLHGSRQTPEDLRRATGYAFERLADQHGFIAVYPQGYKRRWNDCRAGGRYAARRLDVDDVGFLAAIVKQLRVDAGVDSTRVFLAGYSGGGQLAFRVALEHPERVAGVAAFSANLPTDDNLACKPVGSAVPVMLINGTRDRINPYAGGKVTVFGFASRGTVRSSPDSAAYFAARAGPATPARTKLGESAQSWVEQWRWVSPGAPEVLLLAVHGGGHVVPGPRAAFPRILGPVCDVLDGPREVWRFFARQLSTAERASGLGAVR